MSVAIIITTILGYIALLFTVAYISGRRADNEGFFVGNRSSNWGVVMFAMVGAAMSILSSPLYLFRSFTE